MDRKLSFPHAFAWALLALCASTAGLAQECATFNCGSPQAMRIRQGPNFNHVLPAGWEVTEEGKHALVLRSRDLSAGIITYGVSGFTQSASPQAFAYQAMTNSMRIANVRFLDSWPVRPMPGYNAAAAIEVTYTVPGASIRGLVISNLANVYARTDGVITIVSAKEQIWDAYADWLPQIAMLAINTGPDPFGRDGVSRAILNDVQRLNQVAAAHRDWSRRTWEDVARHRAEVQTRQSQGLDPMLTGKQWYDNPYGGQPIRQSAGPAVIWINRNGEQLPSDNPAFDPRTPTDPDWQRLVLKKP